MAPTEPAYRPPSPRAAEAIGRFATFVSALDRGRLRQAEREQSRLKRLGFHIEVSPLSSPPCDEGDACTAASTAST
jgi:hypothetical protein